MITVNNDYALVVDDESNNRDFVELLLQKAGMRVLGAATAEAGIALVKDSPQIKLALIDHELPDMTGINLAKVLRSEAPHLIIVMATMHDNRDLIDEAFEAGISTFLVKPHGFMELYQALLADPRDILSGQTRFIIDQYGPHLYRGAARQTNTAFVQHTNHLDLDLKANQV